MWVWVITDAQKTNELTKEIIMIYQRIERQQTTGVMLVFWLAIIIFGVKIDKREQMS